MCYRLPDEPENENACEEIELDYLAIQNSQIAALLILHAAEEAQNFDGRSNPRSAKRQQAWQSSLWERMLTNSAEELKNPHSKESKSFRNRFRVPFPIFERLVVWTKTWYERDEKGENKGIREHDAAGTSRIPTRLKVLAVLRILGRGTCLDGINELSGISTTAINSFFSKRDEVTWLRSCIGFSIGPFVRFSSRHMGSSAGKS
jgi:hypothetical protein